MRSKTFFKVSFLAVFVLLVALFQNCGDAAFKSHLNPNGSVVQIPVIVPSSKTLLSGRWGGLGASLNIADDPTRGAYLEFDCADGAIPGEIALDEHGHFRVEGTIYGGPGAWGFQQPPADPVIYEGDLVTFPLPPPGSEMPQYDDYIRFTVTYTDPSAGGRTLGPYEVYKDQMPRVHKCYY